MNYKFELDDKQIERYKEWIKTLPKLGNGHFGAIGGGYSFEFIPTGLGMIVKAKRGDGYEIDLTDYDLF